MIHAVIFDLDGTLVRLPIDYEKLRAKIRGTLGLKEAPSRIFEVVEEATAGLPELRAKVFLTIDEAEAAALSKIEILEDAPKVLSFLKAKRYRLALATLQGRRTALQALTHTKLLDYFELVIAREDSLNRRAQIELACRKMGLPAKEVLVVGDRVADVKAAKDLGCSVFAVRYGREPIAEADQNVSALKEIISHLGV